MKTTINYHTNDQLWTMESIAKSNGYTKTADCYWTQIFTNESGDEVITVREDACGDPIAEFRAAVIPAVNDLVETVEPKQAPANPRTLYFEGAGCVARGDVPNCRIRTAFHLDDGTPVYLEISGMETTRCSAPMYKRFKNYGVIDHLHLIPGSGNDRAQFGIDPCYAFEYSMSNILALVNSLGASFDAVEVLPDLAGYRVHGDGRNCYNFGDEFVKDSELLTAREAVNEHIREKEIARGEKYPCYSLWVDSEDPAILHYHNCRTGEHFDICVDAPNDPEKLPTLHKSNAVVGAYYAGCGYLLKVYRISEEYAERYHLMYLDRCEVSNYGDIAIPGSDVYRHKGTCV